MSAGRSASPPRAATSRTGFDATRPENDERLGRFDFIWLHTPYWRMIAFNEGDARCLSSAASVEAFSGQLALVLRNCGTVLAPSGKLALLMGDEKHAGRSSASARSRRNRAPPGTPDPEDVLATLRGHGAGDSGELGAEGRDEDESSSRKAFGRPRPLARGRPGSG